MNRTNLITGPAKCSFGGASFFSQEDIAATIAMDTFDVKTAAHGKIDERIIDVQVDAPITMDGRWSQAVLDAIWNPFANMVLGASLLTATDKPLVMSASDGEIHTAKACAVTKIPDIIFSAEKTLVGQMTISGLRAKDALWSDADAVYAIATSGGSIADTGFAPSAIITQPYLATWGAVSGFAAMDSETGWTASFDLKYEAKKIDRLGKIDFRFQELSVMVKGIPIGPTATQIRDALKIQGTGAVRGKSLNASAADLTITGADAINYMVLKNAAIKTAGFRFGATVLRNNEVGFVATRGFSSGAQQALYTLSIS